MSKRDLIIQLITNIVGNKETASMVVDALQEEGLIVLGYGDRDVDTIVDKFAETFGTTKTTKYDRFAATRLANKYGSQSVVGIITMLAQRSDDKYAPVVNNVSELESKFVSILNFVRKQAQDSEVIDVN